MLHARSSQPIPPAPTSRTFVFFRFEYSSGPSIAFACVLLPLALLPFLVLDDIMQSQHSGSAFFVWLAINSSVKAGRDVSV